MECKYRNYEILYKTDSSSGYYIGEVNSDEKVIVNNSLNLGEPYEPAHEKDEIHSGIAVPYVEVIPQKIKDLQKKYNWVDYKCFEFGYGDKSDDFTNGTSMTPFDIASATDLIYNPENNKYYEPLDIIPYPSKEDDINEEFDIKIEGDKVTIKSKYETTDCSLDIYELKLSHFTKALEKTNYANMSLINYKILGWKKDNKTRIIVQLYSDDNMYKVLDTTNDIIDYFHKYV